MFQNYLEARDFFTTQYHGTSFDNAKNIVLLKQGLIPKKPLTTSGLGNPAVYLTPNIQLAIRYAIGGLSHAKSGQTPVVLEVVLYDSKRHKNMRSDPLDRSDNAWQNHYESDFIREEPREIEDAIKEFIELMGKKYKFTVPYFIDMKQHELEDFNNLEIYNFIKNYIQKLTPQWNMIKNDVSRFLMIHLPPETSFANGKIVINQNGVLKLTPEYYHAQHQNYYTKQLPYKTIKSVWIRKSDFPNVKGKETMMGAEVLPSEVVDEFEEKKRKLEDLENELRKNLDDKEELENIKNDIEDEDLQAMIDELIDSEDPESLLDEIGDKAKDLSTYLYDDYHYDTKIIKDKTIWVNITPEQFSQLMV